MAFSSDKKGKDFELEVAEVLGQLVERHRDVAEFSHQPRINLYNGETVVPDFELTFTLPFARSRYLIECQDRVRIKADVAHKISCAKAFSRRNKFIFLYRNAMSQSARKALRSGGVLVMSLGEFVSFVARVDVTLTSLDVLNEESSRSILRMYEESDRRTKHKGEPQVCECLPQQFGRQDRYRRHMYLSAAC